MKILALWATQGGIGHYRIYQPLKALQFKHDVTLLPIGEVSPKQIIEASFGKDIFIISCPISAYWEQVFEQIKKHTPSIQIVVDYDDDILAMNPYNQAYEMLGRKEVKGRITAGSDMEWIWKHGQNIDISANKQRLRDTYFMLKKYADVITTPSKVIQRLVGKIFPTKKTILLPNGVDTFWFSEEVTVIDDTFNIGYTCSASHYLDFREFFPAIAQILKQFPNIVYHHFGPEFNFLDAPLEQIVVHPWCDTVNEYGSSISNANLDLGICYVNKDHFNLYKSPLKWEEFSACGIPTICSTTLYGKYVPFDCAYFIHGSAAMYNTIKEIYLCNELPHEIAKRAHNLVKSQYSVEAVAKLYEKGLQNLL